MPCALTENDARGDSDRAPAADAVFHGWSGVSQTGVPSGRASWTIKLEVASWTIKLEVVCPTRAICTVITATAPASILALSTTPAWGRYRSLSGREFERLSASAAADHNRSRFVPILGNADNDRPGRRPFWPVGRRGTGDGIPVV
jgi:hypothetical protein